MSVYSHRPPPPPPQTSTLIRVSELLDAVKVEVDAITQEANLLKLQRDEYEHKISAQINEMNAFQQNLYDLERTHQKVKQQYEDEILRLRRELDQRAPPSSVPPHPQHQQQQQPPPPLHQQQQQQQPQLPQPPNIGPSQSNLFGGIIGAQGNLAVGGAAGGNMTGPPVMQDPQQSRQQSHIPYGASQVQAIPHPSKRMRTEGDAPPSGQQQPPTGYPPQIAMNQPQQMSMGMYEGFSPASGAMKKEPPHHGPSTLPGMNAIASTIQHPQPPSQTLQHPLQMHHPHQLPQQHGTQLPQHAHQHQHTHPHAHQHQLQHQHHPNSGPVQPLPISNNNGPVPIQNAKLAAAASQSSTTPSTTNVTSTSISSSSSLISAAGDDLSKRKPMFGSVHSAPSAIPQQQPSPQQHASQHQQSQSQHHRSSVAQGPVAIAPGKPAGVPPQASVQGNGSALPVIETLGDMDPDSVPAQLKKEGGDWFAIFNPKVPRVLNVELVHNLDHSSVVCCVRFSHDGKYLATGCNRSAQIYDVHTGQKICVLADETVGKEGDLYIRSVCFSPDGKYLATGAEDKQIRIWDIGKKRIRNLFSGHEQDIYSLDFSKDGRLVVSGSGDRTARVWDMETGKALHTLSIEDTGSKDAGVTSVAISPDGRLVAAGSLDKMVRVWDANTGYFLERLEGHKDSVYSVAFAPDGKGIVSGSLDKTLKMWDLTSVVERTNGGGGGGGGARSGATGTSMCRTTFLGHKDFVLSVACSPCGNWVVSGSKDRGVQFWDPRTAQTQFMLQGHKNSVISVALSPVGGQFATGSGDCRARIWKYEKLGG